MSSLSGGGGNDGAGGVLNRWFAPDRNVNIEYVNNHKRAMYVAMGGQFVSVSAVHTSGYQVTVKNPIDFHSETFRYHATSSVLSQTVRAYGSFLVPKGGSYLFTPTDGTFVFDDIIEYY